MLANIRIKLHVNHIFGPHNRSFVEVLPEDPEGSLKDTREESCSQNELRVSNWISSRILQLLKH